MLYLLTYDAVRLAGEEEHPLLEEMQRLGENRFVFPGCYLLSSPLTALGIRKRLLPFLGHIPAFVIVQLVKDRCAGKLPPKTREFVKISLGEDIAPRDTLARPYSF